jgi:predicted restriction endonuclease
LKKLKVPFADPYTCYFCGLEEPLVSIRKFREVLEKHHIKERNQKGTNEVANIVPCCSSCHSLVHQGILKVDKWYDSSDGKILHWWDEKGTERWNSRKLKRLEVP